MDTSTGISQDGNSDYGSDFTIEQEEILNRLLQETLPTSVPDLYHQLADIEDDEDSPTSRSSLKSRQSHRSRRGHSSPRWKKAKTRVPIHIEGHDGSSTTGKSRI